MENDYKNFRVEKEVMVRTPNGIKTKRFIDVAVLDLKNNVIKGYQVGVSTQKGLAVIRERRAMKDIADVLGKGIVEFIKYR